MIQKRVQSWLKDVPTLQANLLDAFSTLALSVDVFSESDVQNAITGSSDLPVTLIEGQVLARALVGAGGTSMDGMVKLVNNLLSGVEF